METDVERAVVVAADPDAARCANHGAVLPLARGRRIAAAIAGAGLVVPESDNHVVLPGEPERPRFRGEVEGPLSGNWMRPARARSDVVRCERGDHMFLLALASVA